MFKLGESEVRFDKKTGILWYRGTSEDDMYVQAVTGFNYDILDLRPKKLPISPFWYSRNLGVVLYEWTLEDDIHVWTLKLDEIIK